MVELKRALENDVKALVKTQISAFDDDNKLKPPGCSMEGPPGYDSADWNIHWIQDTPYYKILSAGQIVGGLILFNGGEAHFEVGRILIDPEYQNQGIGGSAMQAMFSQHPDVKKWTLGTPSWAIWVQHFYEKMGFTKIRETEIDPILGWSGIEYQLIRI